jgi:hypothetical protein
MGCGFSRRVATDKSEGQPASQKRAQGERMLHSFFSLPGSSPGAATRSSPARESAPACSDESTAAADPSLVLMASRCVETVLPSATLGSARHRVGRASAGARRRRESSPHPQSNIMPSRGGHLGQTTDSSPSAPGQSRLAQAIHGKIFLPLPTPAPASFHPSPQSPCPPNKSVCQLG